MRRPDPWPDAVLQWASYRGGRAGRAAAKSQSSCSATTSEDRASSQVRARETWPAMLTQLCVGKVRAVSRRGVDARSRGSGRERTKAGVGWRRRSGGGAQGVAQGMAETGTAPGSSMPWKPTTQRAAVSRVHTGGALWGEVQKK